MTQPTQPQSRTVVAMLAALAASFVTLAATLFKTNERDLTFTLSSWDTFSSALSIAAVPALIYFVVLAVFGVFGWLRNWWRALIFGTIAAVVGETLGYLLQIVSNGLALDGEAWAAVFGELLGLGFPFVVSGMLSATLVAPVVWRKLLGEDARPVEPAVTVPTSTDEPGSAFLRVPSEALLERLEQSGLDANAQWEHLVAVFEEHGWGTEAVPGGEREKRSTLLGDAALVLGEQVIMARPKQDAPAGQHEVRAALEVAGAVFDELEAPAVFNPADVVEGHGVLYVGVGNETNASALRGLQRLVQERGYRVVAVPMVGGVALSDAMSVLPNGTKLIWREAIASPEVLGSVLVAPEPRGAAVVSLTPEVIAVSADAPATAELLEQLGYRAERVEISAFAEIGGTLPRLSLRSRD